jgi:uncharacterized membrane protein (UPF0127 family)
MKIFNLTRKRFLCERVKVAKSVLEKARGLMFIPKISEKEGLLMEFESETKPAIWMLFMRFPIDIVFINKEKRIAEIKENAKPISIKPSTWKIYKPKNKCKWVLEIKAGVIKKTSTRKNDKLSFV